MDGNIKAQRALRCIGRPVIYAWPSKFKWTHHLNESHESLEAATVELATLVPRLQLYFLVSKP